MKNIGIVRRLDDLGRIAIPKEIRRTLEIDYGALMEFYIDDEKNLVLKPYRSSEILSDLERYIIRLEEEYGYDLSSCFEEIKKKIEGC